MSLVLCPCCGGRGVVKDINEAKLTGLERKIFEAVQEAGARGISMRGLTDRIYEDRFDGGPDSAENCTRVRVNRMNKRLAEFGYRVKATHLGGGAMYCLVAL